MGTGDSESELSRVRKAVRRKGGGSRPLYVTGEASLAFLPGLLLPALHLLRHCRLSPPSFGLSGEERRVIDLVAAAWHAHSMSPLLREAILGMVSVFHPHTRCRLWMRNL